jgi:hypothetical protein
MNEREQKELFSVKVTAERRKYFFDVKMNKDGQYYLVISEINSRNERSRVMIFEETIEEFEEGLQKAGEYIRKRQKPSTRQSTRVSRDDNGNSFGNQDQ